MPQKTNRWNTFQNTFLVTFTIILVFIFLFVNTAAEGVPVDDWTLIEDFEDLLQSDLDGQNGWVGSEQVIVAADPQVPTEKAVRITSINNGAYKNFPQTLTDTSTLFFRIQRTGATDAFGGVSHLLQPADFDGFKTQFGTRPTHPNEFSIRDGSSFYQSEEDFWEDTWYCVWLTINNDLDRYQVHISGGQFTIPVMLSDSFLFRNTPPATDDPLSSFYMRSGSNEGTIYFDDIYIDTSSENLTRPAAAQCPHIAILPTPEPSGTFTMTPSATPEPTDISTMTPSTTPIPSVTPSSTPPSPTDIPTLTATVTVQPTSMLTATPQPTVTIGAPAQTSWGILVPMVFNPPPTPTQTPFPTATFTPAPPTSTPEPPLPPPSFNGCRSNPTSAVNYPVKITTVDKRAETVTLKNVSPRTINLAGWRMCSLTGNQEHRGIGGELAPGQSKTFGHTGGNIWNNSNDDDGALYNSSGQLVSFWND